MLRGMGVQSDIAPLHMSRNNFKRSKVKNSAHTFLKIEIENSAGETRGDQTTVSELVSGKWSCICALA